uniref:Uncharacterized protein n=1 Tax=Homalodisca liturata TaxID=320908 RepID=A0A1B6J4J2_9HEMI
MPVVHLTHTLIKIRHLKNLQTKEYKVIVRVHTRFRENRMNKISLLAVICSFSGNNRSKKALHLGDRYPTEYDKIHENNSVRSYTNFYKEASSVKSHLHSNVIGGKYTEEELLFIYY